MAEVNDILQFRVFTVLGAQTAIWVSHWKVTAKGGAGASNTVIAGKFASDINAAWKALITSAATYRGVGVRRIRPTQSIESYSTTGQGIGGQIGDTLPKQVAGIISLYTNLPGRRGRGRCYLPFAAESDNDSDTTPGAGYNTRRATMAAFMTVPFTATAGADSNELTPGIYHRDLGTIDTIVFYSLPDRWATQRRRGDYGRTNASPL